MGFWGLCPFQFLFFLPRAFGARFLGFNQFTSNESIRGKSVKKVTKQNYNDISYRKTKADRGMHDMHVLFT